MHTFSIWLSSAGILLALMTVLWGVATWIKDVSIVDRFWGLTFAVQYSFFLYLSDQVIDFRQGLVAILVWVWSLRLSVHIHTRNKGHGEDPRYQKMREEHGDEKFRWYSLFSVFWLQTGLSLLVALPLAWIALVPGGHAFTVWDLVALVLWGTGFTFEALGDWQLRQFKKKPENKGKLLTSGLWSLTRHPNYFGDATLWWGYFFFALPSEYGYLSVAGPIVMSLFIYHVSGVKLLEKDLIERKPDYADYIKSTPAFFPSLRKLM